ncbi:YhgE/Pip domain-containing protein [Rossellomorea aquimaris]|uniref:YhgE/Pip domain-containing protein n=1 Tax=Rossellomorea aquimaris TaxID=189382 RepID=UPI001CD3A388|nr:YhgE/Pip domain-containing protein [Rossellomorea aquimaris]MCA1055858.1 YhgE/Pip domain-containing protein [Rossellomorea aquimaris]
MRKKQLTTSALALMIILPSFLSVPAEAATEGKVSSKDEVVYATLDADGNLDHIYVVNTFEVERAGKILDYGQYKNVKNLTDLSEVEQEGQEVKADAPEGKFTYQGNMEEGTELPWDVSVSYTLDGKEVDPTLLAGKSGHLEIMIDTAKNTGGNPVFYENYLMQVSLSLPNTYENIEAADGMVANAGKNKQITFTVLPGKEKKLSVEADVKDFEFKGVELAAVPSTLPIDATGTEGMTGDLSELSDAIGKLNDGVAELENGVSQLNNGAASLRDGSSQYRSGIGELNGSSSQLVGASGSIKEALAAINQSLSSQSAGADLSSLNELPAGLEKLANGLKETANGMRTLRDNYSQAFAALDGAIKEIPASQVTEEEIAALRNSAANKEVVDKLAASHLAAQKVKGTYASVNGAFAAVEPSLNQMSGAVTEISGQLTAISTDLSASLKDTNLNGLAELQKGLGQLSAKYGDFHSGLVGYTNGVDQLASSYGKLHSGITELAGGTSQLKNGVSELHDGTTELYQETKDLPEKMQAEINKMMDEYDKSDFKPVSFVSEKNEKVSSVQFVIKTESIEKEEKKVKKAEPEKEKGFWELFLDLFKQG